MHGKALGIVGAILTILGVGATLGKNFIEKRQLDELIEQKVNDALNAEAKKEEES
jgi:hypothetical protein